MFSHVTLLNVVFCVAPVRYPPFVDGGSMNKFSNTPENRQKYIKPYRVDGYDYKTNTIYEFLGDFFHGNPSKYQLNKINSANQKTFWDLYEKTFIRLNELKERGYNN